MKNLTQTILEDCDGESESTTFSQVKRINKNDQRGKIASIALINLSNKYSNKLMLVKPPKKGSASKLMKPI